MMKNNPVCLFVSCIVALGLSACGGGGGGGGGVTTAAATKVYLFGNMSSPTSFGNLSSHGRIATVRTTMTVPNGILVNYSSAPGATAGLCILRKGTIVPSGPVTVAASDFNMSSYDIASRVLTINMVNSRVLLKSNSTGNGAEFATINFTLATPGVTQAMPSQDLLASISEELPTTPPSVVPLPGRSVNFTTTYH